MAQSATNRQAIRSQNARDAIIQAALRVFAARGYAAASMDDVCAAAGCSKGGLYHHYRSKADVLLALVERLAAPGGYNLTPAPEAGATPEPAIARILVDAWAEATRNADLRQQFHAACADDADAEANAGVEALLATGAIVRLALQSAGVRADATPDARAA